MYRFSTSLLLTGGEYMNNSRKVLSENLKSLIHTKGIDQRRLAEEIGVSEMSVSNWVKGAKYPRIDKIQAMSDYFGVNKSDIIEDKIKESSATYMTASTFTYFPTAISAGLPFEVDGMTEASEISISDEVLGKYANDREIFFARINGDSMNNLMEDNSLIAIKPVTLDSLKNGDIVVYSTDGEYSVKHYHKYGDTLVFKPNSTKSEHSEHEYSVNDDIRIHGKVVTYIVNVD